MSVLKKSRVPATRSRNGCLTCRARHIKCDEGLPNCKNCIKSNKVCQRGKRLNFFKIITGGSSTFHNSILNKRIRFLDQSYTIHKVYKNNKYHDYSNWLKYHSKNELLESDEDFKRSMEIGNSASLALIQQLNDSSDSDSTSQRDNSSVSTSTNASQFNVGLFISKIVSFFVVPVVDQTLFVNSHRNSILLHASDIQLTNVIDNEITLSDFENFINYLQQKEFQILLQNTIEFDVNSRMELVSHFTIFLNCLVFALKTNRIYLFQQSFISSKIISYINQKIHDEEYQTFENLMNYYELLLLDLNESLKSNNPSLIMNSIHDNLSFDFLLNKILNLNLFDDLSYFIIRISIILIKLNNIHHFHDKRKTQSLLSSLSSIVKDLKDLENNQILTMYFPNYSLRSNPLYQQQIKPSVNLQFQNLKIQRFHIFYNFVLSFIIKHYSKYLEIKNLAFNNSGVLLNLWNGLEPDVHKRIKYLTLTYDFTNDPFMSFIRKAVL